MELIFEEKVCVGVYQSKYFYRSDSYRVPTVQTSIVDVLCYCTAYYNDGLSVLYVRCSFNDDDLGRWAIEVGNLVTLEFASDKGRAIRRTIELSDQYQRKISSLIPCPDMRTDDQVLDDLHTTEEQ